MSKGMLVATLGILALMVGMMTNMIGKNATTKEEEAKVKQEEAAKAAKAEQGKNDPSKMEAKGITPDPKVPITPTMMRDREAKERTETQKKQQQQQERTKKAEDIVRKEFAAKGWEYDGKTSMEITNKWTSKQAEGEEGLKALQRKKEMRELSSKRFQEVLKELNLKETGNPDGVAAGGAMTPSQMPSAPSPMPAAEKPKK